MTSKRDVSIALVAVIAGAVLGGIAVHSFDRHPTPQPQVSQQPLAPLEPRQPISSGTERPTGIAVPDQVRITSQQSDGAAAPPTPPATVDGHPVKLPAGIVQAAREAAGHQQVTEAAFLQDVARKTKTDPDPAIKEVFGMLRAGKPEPEVLDYVGKNIHDRLQSVMTVGMVKDFFHAAGSPAVDSPLGSGGGPSLVPKPTLAAPPSAKPSDQGL